jgi:GT2 family glycosyltransferase
MRLGRASEDTRKEILKCSTDAKTYLLLISSLNSKNIFKIAFKTYTMQENLANPFISVIIVNFNGLRFLEPCLSSLKNQSCKNFEIILVDNGSSDCSTDYVRSQFPEVRILETGKNLGFAGGTNVGINHARGDFILTLNNDTVVDVRFIEELQNSISNDRKIGMWATKMLYPDGRLNSTGLIIARDGTASDRGIGEMDCNQFDSIGEVFGPSAGSALYRKSMLDEIGLFDEDFFLYMEDVDLAFRARLFGWKCVYNPSAKIIHERGGTTGIGSDISIYYGCRNAFWCIVKNYPLRTFLKYLPWIIKTNCADIPFYSRKGKLLTLLRAKKDMLFGIGKMIKKRKVIRKRVNNYSIECWIQH